MTITILDYYIEVVATKEEAAFPCAQKEPHTWTHQLQVVPAPTSVLPPESRTLMTNSAKYAHYAPGLSHG